MSMTKAVIYCRVSTCRQAEEGTSLEAQQAICLLQANALGAQVIATYQDDLSGALYLTRPGIQAALADIEAGRANMLIIYKVDRSGRDVDVVRDIAKRIHAARAQLVFTDDGLIENNANGKVRLTLKAMFAEWEKEQIRERTMSGRRRRAGEGVQPMRSRSAYGYHVVTQKDILTGAHSPEQIGQYMVVEEQARFAREIFLRIASGSSLRRACQWLNDSGVPTPQGARQWGEKTVQTLLANPVYKGEAVFGRYETTHDEKLVTERGWKSDVRLRLRPRSEWITIPAPALVDPQTWETCQERMRRNKELLGGNPRRRFMLTSLIRCPVCGCKMAGANKKSKRVHGPDKALQYYICHPKRNDCPEKYYPARIMEDQTTDAIRLTSEQPEYVESVLCAYEDDLRDSTSTEIDDMRERLTEDLRLIQEREHKTAEAQIDALVKGRSTEVYDRLLTDIDSEKASVQAKLREVAPRQSNLVPGSPKTAAEKIATALSELHKALTASDVLTPAERQGILATGIETITPTPSGLKIQLRSETVYSV